MQRIKKDKYNVLACFEAYFKIKNIRTDPSSLSKSFNLGNSKITFNYSEFIKNSYPPGIKDIRTSITNVDTLIAVSNLSRTLNLTVYIFNKRTLSWLLNPIYKNFICLNLKNEKFDLIYDYIQCLKIEIIKLSKLEFKKISHFNFNIVYFENLISHSKILSKIRKANLKKLKFSKKIKTEMSHIDNSSENTNLSLL